MKAFNDWNADKVVKLLVSKPMFRLADGQCYTGAHFNHDLKVLLRNEVDYDKTPVTAHSFRSGRRVIYSSIMFDSFPIHIWIIFPLA